MNLQNTQKLANLLSLFGAQMLKIFQLQGVSSPDPLRGLYPLDLRWVGGSALCPRYRLALPRSQCCPRLTIGAPSSSYLVPALVFSAAKSKYGQLTLST